MLNLSSTVPMEKDALQDYAFSQSQARWANVDTEVRLWQEAAQGQFERKMKKRKDGFVIMHANPRHITGLYLEPVVHHLNRLIQDGPNGRAGLLISATSFGYNKSWLLEKGREPVTRFSDETFTKTWVTSAATAT